MVSDDQLDADMIHWGLKYIPRAFRTQSSDALPSKVTKLYILRVASLVDLLTVGDHPHILDKTMNNLKDLCSGQFRLVLSESV
jgi:hypothetical protein